MKKLLFHLLFACIFIYTLAFAQDSNFDPSMFAQKVEMLMEKYEKSPSKELKDKISKSFYEFSNLSLEQQGEIKFQKRVTGDLIVQIQKFAKGGHRASAESILNFGTSEYGKTSVEGSEFTNELIWELFHKQPVMVMEILAAMPIEKRNYLIKDVFTSSLLDINPITLKNDLKNYKPPENFKNDYDKILEYIDKEYQEYLNDIKNNKTE
jgi:hypothetical protein